VVIITHNTAISAMADKVIHFRSGQVQHSIMNDHPVPIADIEW
jgi:putative ABC transport system ATP-binding protein